MIDMIRQIDPTCKGYIQYNKKRSRMFYMIDYNVHLISLLDKTWRWYIVVHPDLPGTGSVHVLQFITHKISVEERWKM